MNRFYVLLALVIVGMLVFAILPNMSGTLNVMDGGNVSSSAWNFVSSLGH